jgi:hypothetical protein
VDIVLDPALLNGEQQSNHGFSATTETLTIYAADSSQPIANCVSGSADSASLDGSSACSDSVAFPFTWPSCYTSSEEDPGAQPDCPRWTWTTLDHEERVVAIQDQPDSVERITWDAMNRPVWRWSGPADSTSATSAVGTTSATVTRYAEFGRASHQRVPGGSAGLLSELSR